METKTGIHRAVERFDNSPSKLAAACSLPGVRRQHVEHWLRAGRVPAAHAPTVERVAQVPCEDLCPGTDWAYLRGTPAPEDEAPHVHHIGAPIAEPQGEVAHG